MKHLKYLLLAGLVVLLSAFTIQKSISYKIKDGYSIKFSGTDVNGIFKTLSGNVIFDEKELDSSSFNFEIEVNSINTGNGIKNKHAKSSKWFDAEKYPNIVFESNKITKSEEGYTVTGKLKIHGVEKEMTVPFTFSKDVITTKFSVNRLDFKVGTMEGSMKKVSNEIKLDVSIPLTKK